MLVVWLGFEVHVSPRFAGSAWGGALAVTGSLLMLVPAAYILVKRIKRIRNLLHPRISMRTLLAIHIYAGVIGPILVILHTGHKFESALGVALTSLTLIVVLSGFIGRYLLARINRALRHSDSLIRELERRYEETGDQLRESDPDSASRLLRDARRAFPGLLLRPSEPLGPEPSPIRRAVALSDAIADLEYSHRIQATVKRMFQAWLKTHIVLSCALYFLMALHVWASIHFGIRWFE